MSPIYNDACHIIIIIIMIIILLFMYIYEAKVWPI